MKVLILFLIIAYWLYNYVKFRRMNNYYKLMVAYLTMEVNKSPNIDNKLRLSSALIHIQQYRDAYEILVQLYNDGVNSVEGQKIRANIDFCKSPVPGICNPKNLNHSYWHNFLLVRLGKKRYEFITDEDYLRTNSIQRNI